MSKLEKLDLLGVASLAAVTAALLVAWMVTSHDAARQVRPVAKAPSVTFTDDGSMKLTVTASHDGAQSYTAVARSASARPVAGPALEVALPHALRP
jgi:hypothetical protein